MGQSELFSILDSVDSTNNYAMGMVHAGMARHGMGWFAMEQTAGKGQRGNHWQTGKGENIALSIVLDTNGLAASRQFQFSVAVALACHEFFSELAGSETSIKWPNDIYWGDRKAGGILIENILHGREWKFSVVGIGININQLHFGPNLKNAVSLRQIRGREYNPVKLAQELHLNIIQSCERLKIQPFEPLLALYNASLYKRNAMVKLRKDNIVFETRVKAVSPEGQLLTSGALEEAFDFGKVEWLID